MNLSSARLVPIIALALTGLPLPLGAQPVPSEGCGLAGRPAITSGFYAPPVRDALKLLTELRKRNRATTRAYAATKLKLANLYRDGGAFKAAETCYRKAAAAFLALAGTATLDIARTNSALAELYRQLARYADAEALLQKSLKLQQEQVATGKAGFADLAATLATWAKLHQNLYRKPQALELINRTMALQPKIGPGSHPSLANAASAKGALLLFQYRFVEAGKLLKRGLELRRTILDPAHPDIGQSLNLLGLLAIEQGQPEKAQPLLDQALVLFSRSLAPTHPLIAAVKTNLGRIALARRQFKAADQAFVDAATQLKASLGPEHPWVASVYFIQATGLTLRKEYKRSKPLFERAIAILAKVLGANHPQVGQLLHTLAFSNSRQGRLDEALGYYRRSLIIREKAFGVASLPVAETLTYMGLIHARKGRLDQALAMYRRSLTIREKLLKPTHILIAVSLNNLAAALKNKGQFAEASSAFEKSLKLYEAALGPRHLSVATALSNFADLKISLARLDDAEHLLKRSLEIYQQKLGKSHPKTAVTLNNLGRVYQKLTRFEEANAFYLQSLQIRIKAYGQSDARVATVLNNLASLHQDQGRYRKAEKYFTRSLAIRRKVIAQPHQDIAVSLNNLATLYHATGKYQQAEKLFNQSREMWEKTLGLNHPQIAISLNNLAALYQEQGRLEDAEPVFKRSLAIRERYFGATHPETILSIQNLAVLYDAQGRPVEAEHYFLRALKILDQAPGTNQLSIALTLNNLATFYKQRLRYKKALPLFQRALNIRQSLLRPDHPDIGVLLSNIALTNQELGQYTKAEPLFERSMAIALKAKGPNHPSLARVMNNFAILKEKLNRPDEALKLYEQSLAIKSRAYGATHPTVVTALSNLANFYFERRQWARAVSYYKKSTEIITRRTRTSALATGKPLTGNKKSEAARSSWEFSLYVKAAYHSTQGQPDKLEAIQDRMFQIAQRGAASQAAASLAQMAARQGAGNGPLATLVRTRQDLVFEWQKVDSWRAAAVTRPAARRNRLIEQANIKTLKQIDQKVANIDARLAREFPQYSALANPAAVSISDIQRKLKTDEALMYFLDTRKQKPLPEETFVWVITSEKRLWFRSTLGSTKLNTMVATLRKTLDRSSSANQRSVVLSFGAPRSNNGYNFKLAHTLFSSLVAPAESLLHGKTKLIVVPSGPLTSLPFQVLTTADYKPGGKEKPAWLIRRFALTTLPSVNSLTVLRNYPRQKKAPNNFIGFADPQFRPPQFASAGNTLNRLGKSPRGPNADKSLSAGKTAGLSTFFRGGSANPIALSTLAQLPDTADEVRAIAATFRTGTRLHLGGNASERIVKREKLSQYRVIHFATHGLVAGEIKNLAQPALALTVPADPTALDDGLLTSTEIATLKLNADWVILSACNTAAGERTGAEALSGLANAFFYAGARSLLVSHWPVVSSAAVKLTTSAFSELQRNPAIGKSEALRRAMIALADSGDAAHRDPSYWAPFVIVGDSGS